MAPDDIAEMVWVGDPQLSPDGLRVAYVLHAMDGDANAYRSQIWLASVDDTSRPRPLTSGRRRDSSPQWSPDGTALAFASAVDDPDAADRFSIRSLPVDRPGETATLVTGPEPFEFLQFSPNGEWLAYRSRTRHPDYGHEAAKDRPPRRIDRLAFTLNGVGFTIDRPGHIHVVPTNRSSGPINLTPGRDDYSTPSWYPDGRRLAAVATRGDRDLASEVRVLSVDGEDPRTISARGNYMSATVSPDGHRVAVGGNDDPSVSGVNHRIGVLENEAERPRWITDEVDRTWFSLLNPVPARWIDDRRIVGHVEDRGAVHLYTVDVDGRAERLIAGDRTVTGSSMRGSTVAFAASTGTEPAELHVAVDGVETKLTDHSGAFVTRTEPRPLQPIAVLSGHGSEAVEVDAWLMTPHGFDSQRCYPMLVNIHGGPFTQYGHTFFDEAQMQCRAGFVVVMANPRGSSGREEGWGTAILGPQHPVAPGSGWGALDFQDVMAVVDTVVDRHPFIDRDRLGVLGGSYGGYMTSWIVTHDDRFAAACSERAVNNLLSLEAGADLTGFFHTIIGPRFYEDPAEYLRQSPITYVENLDTPLLILHSEDDLRCPIDQADQLFSATRQLGLDDVEYYRFPGENHELSRSGSPTHRRQRAEIILEFFTRHLEPEPI